MKLLVNPSSVSGRVRIPGSKSHTVRALVIATLAEGRSRVLGPLDSADTRACLDACKAIGAAIEESTDSESGLSCWTVGGTAGRPRTAEDVIDVRNSGTTLYVLLSTAALIDGWTVFTGDAQIRRRSAGPLLQALRELGAEAFSTRPGGCAPLLVRGRLAGGRTSIECPTSQYLSSLLINCPMAKGDTTIDVPLLYERPYVEMTCRWLTDRGVRFDAADDFSQIQMPGNQSWKAFEKRIPADFSSATFFLVAAAVTGSRLLLEGLDMADTQGDKAVVGMLERMGCEVTIRPDGIEIDGGELHGCELDLNATPDALPAISVAGCLAEGETRITNVAQARMKETDRIAVMATELRKMGADVEELPDGLVVRKSDLKGAAVHGWDDHRVVMALTVAGLAAEGETVVDTAEAMSVTFPTFVDIMQGIGASVERQQ